jgi:Cytochrome c554 and c-prime
VWSWNTSAENRSDVIAPQGYELPFGSSLVAPSNATTTTQKFISQKDFISAGRCLKCHANTHEEWSQSAHRNAFREPFYQANVNHLIHDRGIVVTRHCESCHNPVALFSGALSKNAKFDRPFDEEGVTCSVCHSIQSVTTQGIGSYTIAPPALLVLKDGTRIKDASDRQILDDLELAEKRTHPLLSRLLCLNHAA